MGMSIWSATERAMLSFPARFFVEFFDKHGFLNVDDRPVWQAVKGGSREYMRKLAAPLRASHPPRHARSTGVRRDAAGVTVRTAAGSVERFDHVVHRLPQRPGAEACSRTRAPPEREVLGAFPYQENEAVLHTDERLLPRTPLARAAWNYHLLDVRDNAMRDRVALTYDMNVLQSLDAPVRFLVTLNRSADIDPAKVLQDHHLSPSRLSTGRRGRAEAARRDQRRATAPSTAAPTGVTASTKTASSARSGRSRTSRAVPRGHADASVRLARAV